MLSRLGLAALTDIALANNPETRRVWEQSRAAAAQYGIARSEYYPQANFETDAGFNRLLFQVEPGPAAIQQWSVAPMLNLTYTLLDFGRREADADIARERLAAANFAFNRTMQDVVFGVQRGFYALAAAQGAIAAARQNLELARTDLDAVSRRVELGLATQPALLLARERAAQAEYELENTQTLMNDARAALAVAVGIAADEPFEIQSLENQSVPKKLGSEVEELIASAIKNRPDLAAHVASVRASEAAERRSRSEWMPMLGVNANYSQQSWWYNFNNTPVIKSSQPQYEALVSLKWDVFTGFRRINDDRRTEAERKAQSHALRTREIETIAEVWRAYFDFKNAIKRYQYAAALIAAAKESYADNLETYRQGLSTIVELLTADRDLADARFTMIQATADVLTSSAAVAYAVGSIGIPTRKP